MLTPRGVEELGAVMRRLAASGMAVVFVTHKLNEVLAFGDRVSVLRLGRKAGEIPPERFRAMPPAEATEAIVGMMFGGHAAAPAIAAGGGGAAHGAEVLAVALPGIGFALRAGEVFGVAGVDGNGQRALCEALAGQVRAPRVALGGEDVSALGVAARQARGLRYLTDDRLGEGTIGAFSVALNLLLKRVGEPPCWRRGIADEAAIHAQGAATVAAYDVRTPSPETPIAKLSGGNIQKALFARELHGAPRVLIASKPTYGLDLQNIRAARERIRAAADSGVAVILVSNELDELLELSDRIGVMRRGRMVGIVANGPTAGREVGQLMVGG
jgi:simple sugar transport system ATP-binding protein